MEYRTVYQGGKGEIVEKNVPVYRGSIFGALGGGSHAVSGTDTEKGTGMQGITAGPM